MKELDRAIKKYEKMFLEKIDPLLWSEEKCIKKIKELQNKRRKMISESYYVDIINNKKYFQYILLENICRMILMEIKPKRTLKRKSKKIGIREI